MEPFYQVREFGTIREMLDQSFALFAERTAFEVKKGEEHYNITYAEYKEQLNAL